MRWCLKKPPGYLPNTDVPGGSLCFSRNREQTIEFRIPNYAFRIPNYAFRIPNYEFRITNYLQSAEVLTDLFRTNRISDCSSLS